MKRVLIIDDDPMILEVTQMALEASDFEVRTLNNENGVEDAIEEFNPHTILLDYNIGDSGNGRKICEAIKENPVTKHIRIVLFSALIFDNEDFSNNLFKCFDDYIPKPFDISELIEKAGVK